MIAKIKNILQRKKALTDTVCQGENGGVETEDTIRLANDLPNMARELRDGNVRTAPLCCTSPLPYPAFFVRCAQKRGVS